MGIPSSLQTGLPRGSLGLGVEVPLVSGNLDLGVEEPLVSGIFDKIKSLYFRLNNVCPIIIINFLCWAKIFWGGLKNF